MTAKEKLEAITKVIRQCENKYPMTGKPDKQANYKNGWYDCAYYLRCQLRSLEGA